MAERIFVTDAQVKAARIIVEHNKSIGRGTDPATLRIADMGQAQSARLPGTPPVTPSDAVRRRGVLRSLALALGRRLRLRRETENSPLPRTNLAYGHSREATSLRPDTSFWYALTPAERDALRAAGALRTYAAGDTLFQEGERADHLIVIFGGRAKVSVNRNGRDRVLAIRGLGQLIGERAALEVSVRSATVTAFEMVWALVLQTKDFATFLGAHPRVSGIMQDLLYDRLTEEPTEYEDDQGADAPATGEPGTDPAADYSRQRLELMNGENFTVLLFDVVGLAARTHTDQVRIRSVLASMTAPALQDISGEWREDRGDGFLVVLPPTISTAEVMGRLLKELPAALDRHNSSQRDSLPIQLRLAVNVGPVLSGSTDVSGEAVVIAARMLDTRHFRETVASSQTSLGIIISPFVFETVVRRGSDLTEEASYTPVSIEVKNSSTTAWMKLISRDLVGG
jgi:CRP-like cAMP-binding protein